VEVFEYYCSIGSIDFDTCIGFRKIENFNQEIDSGWKSWGTCRGPTFKVWLIYKKY